MKITRAKRYDEKLNIISERIGDIKDWLADAGTDKVKRFASYKAVMELADAAMDICAMTVKDINLIPKDDYGNIELLEKKGLIDERTKKSLDNANGLRNVLVHKYNSINDEQAIASIETLAPQFEKFVDLIEKWIRKKL